MSRHSPIRILTPPGLMLAVFLQAGAARAAVDPWESLTLDDAELEDWAARGLLTEEALEALREVRREGGGAGRLTREALRALPGMTYARADELTGWGHAGPPPDGLPSGLRGLFSRPEAAVQLRTAFEPALVRVPSTVLRGRVRSGNFGAGAMVAVRRLQPGRVAFDARGSSFRVEAPRPRLELPKAHLRWTGERAQVLAGTFRVGFGQRLTLDTTRSPSPHGFIADDRLETSGQVESACLWTRGELEEAACAPEPGTVASDFRWNEGFRGLAAAGRWGALEGTGFISYQGRAVFASELRDGAGKRLTTRVAREDPLERAQGLRARRLSGVVDELAAGGNLTARAGARSHLGATAWGAVPRWRLGAGALDFDRGAPWPGSGRFGAAGVDAAWGRGGWDVFLEAARSLDREAGGGGWGAVQRSVWGRAHQEVELVLRAYARGFNNPYARPVAAADEREGLRARDERGARLRYVQRFAGGAVVQGELDAWETEAALRVQTEARAVVPMGSWGQGSLVASHRTGPSAVRALGVMEWTPGPSVRLTMDYGHTWAAAQEGARGGVGLAWAPGEAWKLQLALRGRGAAALPERGTCALRWMPSSRVALAARYDVRRAGAAGRLEQLARVELEVTQ